MDALVLPALIFVGCVVGGAVAGAGYLLIGGAGVARVLSRRVAALESDIEQLRSSLTREIKRRAALAATEHRADERNEKALQQEAARRLQSVPAHDPELVQRGFPSMFGGG